MYNDTCRRMSMIKWKCAGVCIGKIYKLSVFIIKIYRHKLWDFIDKKKTIHYYGDVFVKLQEKGGHIIWNMSHW